MKQQPPVALLMKRQGMRPAQEVLKIKLWEILSAAGAGTQQENAESNRKEEIQWKSAGFGPSTEAAQKFTSQ